MMDPLTPDLEYNPIRAIEHECCRCEIILERAEPMMRGRSFLLEYVARTDLVDDPIQGYYIDSLCDECAYALMIMLQKQGFVVTEYKREQK